MFRLSDFLIYCFITAYSPGANNLLSMSNAMRLGFSRSIRFNFGITAGFSIVMALCTIFSAALYSLLPKVKIVMQVLGAAYMLYLAWKVWKSSADLHTDGGKEASFISGMILQFANPKIYIYAITAMSLYILPVCHSLQGLTGFTILLSLIGASGSFVWALFGAAFCKFFSKHTRLVNTVMAIAKKAGVLNYERCIDMSTINDDEIQEVVRNYTIFGRVTPSQKKMIVEALKNDGHHVAMTGDGVNDLLALKEADCSIAIADGSDASKQISQVVLLNSDFTCLPDVLLEGRKVVNNVTRVAGVFFIKTIYTILLSLFCVISNTAFPFIPLQITLIDLLIEAMPSFMTIFEADTRKITGRFLPKVFSKAAGNALSIVILFIAIMIFGPMWKINDLELVTLMYLVLGTISMAAVIRSCYPFTMLRIIICTMMAGGFYGAVLLFSGLLHLAPITLNLVFIGLILSIFGLFIERIIHFVIKKRLA